MNASRLLPICAAIAVLVAFGGCVQDEATATLEYDGPDATQRLPFDFDPADRPAQDAYDDNGVDHPDFYNAHDLTVVWADATGRDVDIRFFDSSFGQGFFLASIDGVPTEGDDRFWQLSVNGTASMAGIHEVRVVDGTTITWSLQSF